MWNLKGGSAPSAIDLNRRPKVLDVMGVERQLVYPTFGLSALIMSQDHSNVRVTPFYFEPVATYLERHPNLAHVYCYSTDCPHFEGGKESKRLFAEALSGVSADLRDKFSYRNATLLLPD